jgi:hypothetical protein
LSHDEQGKGYEVDTLRGIDKIGREADIELEHSDLRHATQTQQARSQKCNSYKEDTDQGIDIY